MANLVSRLGDLTIGVDTCCQNSPTLPGTIITASPNVSCKGVNVARTGDLVLSSCGNIGVLVTGCFGMSNNQKTVRIGDTFVGCYNGNIISGCPNVSCGQ